MVEENARKCESKRAQRARFRHRSTRQQAWQSSRGSLGFVTHQNYISTQVLHRLLIFHASLDECVILTAV